MRLAIVRPSLGLALAILVLCLAPISAQAADKFPLRDGDTWVMVGDSITAQHLHSNYFEAFCFARYPQMNFRFRNSGVGGDTVPKVLARFDWDVAPWKPTVVSVELGMNDQGGYSVPQFIDYMKQLSERIRSIGGRPVFFTSSPVNNGDTISKLVPGGNNGNSKLRAYAEALKKLAAEQDNTPFADQFHAVIDVWGHNKPRENRANLVTTIKSAAADKNLAGVEHLQAFLAEQAKDPEPLLSMQGDPVHPGAPGQLMMAAALLEELNAESFVSSVEVAAGDKVTFDAKGCKVENLQASDGKLSFDRLDECLPFPLPDEARSILPLFPSILGLSQYTLKVTGLKEDQYALTVNGQPVATISAKDLSAGVNLTAYPQGVIATQGKAVLNAVGSKENLVNQWRYTSRVAATGGDAADAKKTLATLAEQVEAADAKIRQTAKPVKLHFELTPTK
jgi:lysophospholipase L1-like esterase